jgi:hypothetical protein
VAPLEDQENPKAACFGDIPQLFTGLNAREIVQHQDDEIGLETGSDRQSTRHVMREDESELAILRQRMRESIAVGDGWRDDENEFSSQDCILPSWSYPPAREMVDRLAIVLLQCPSGQRSRPRTRDVA